MNIDTFGVTQENNQDAGVATDASFVHDDLSHIKNKIQSRKAKQKRLKIILGTLASLIVVLALFAGYSQYKLFKLSRDELVVGGQEDAQAGGAKVTPKTGEEIVKALRRHILLPEGDPQIAEVQDVAKLKETQAFFKDAQNGDIVIVYPTMIYVYRPGVDIVVAASDISGAGQQKP